MDDFHKKALNANLLYLQENLVLSEELYAALLQYKVFNEETIEAIQYERSTKGKISAFVRSLKKCHNGKFDTVLYVLGQVDQSHIAGKLQMTEQVQRNDSANQKIKDKLKTFMHDKFIQNKHFSSVEENFILENLVLKEDYHDNKVQKEMAFIENRNLQYAILEKDKETADLNMKLQVSITENKQNRLKIEKYEEEVNILKAEVKNLQFELCHQRSLLEEAVEQDTSSDEEEVHMMKIGDITSSSDEEDDLQVMKLHDERDGTAEDGFYKEKENYKKTIATMKNELIDKEHRMGVLNTQMGQLLKSAGIVNVYSTTSTNQGNSLEDLDRKIQSLKTLCQDGLFLTPGAFTAPEIVQVKDQGCHSNKMMETKENDMDRQMIENLQTKLNQTRQERNKLKHELSTLQKQLGNIGVKLEKERLKVKKIERDLRSRESTSISNANNMTHLSLDTVDNSRRFTPKPQQKQQKRQTGITKSCIFPELQHLTNTKQGRDLPLSQVNIQFHTKM